MGRMGRIFVIKNGGQVMKKKWRLSGAAARTGKFIKKEDKDLYKKESVGVCK